MTQKKTNTNLGRGLSVLLGDTLVGQSGMYKQNIMPPPAQEKVIAREFSQVSAEIPSAQPLLVDISMIQANPGQPRKIFKQKELDELANSIKENGIIQPLVVGEKVEGKFLLIAGERRLRAATIAGVTKVPVVIKRVTDKEKYVIALIENVQREDLNCVEEGLAYLELLSVYNLTQEELAKKVGKDRASIANYLRVIKLPRSVIELLQNEQLSFGHAKVLCGLLPDKERIILLVKKIVEDGLSVRMTEELVKAQPTESEPTSDDAPTFNSELDELKERMQMRTGLKIAIKSGKGDRGKLVIQYSTRDEFNKLYEMIMR